VAVIVTVFVLVGVAVIVVVLVLAPVVLVVVLVLAELVLNYLVSLMLVVLGDPPVGPFAVVVVVAFVLVGVTVIVVVIVLVSVTVIVTVFVLVGVAVIVVVLVFAPVVLAKDADLIFIPTAARRRGIPSGGGACGASSPRSAGGTRCTRRRSRGAYSG
jgi:hypothetical protein